MPVRRGPITKTGNRELARNAGWECSLELISIPPRVGKEKLERLGGAPLAVREIALKAAGAA